MYSRGFWPLPQASSHLSIPRTSSLSRSITHLAEDGEVYSKTSDCSHSKASACTWVCRLNNRDQQGSANLNTSSTTNGTQSAKRKSVSYSVQAKAPKRRHYEFIPGSFVYKEIISESDDEASLLPKIRGRGTRDKPFYLDLDHTKDFPKQDRPSSLLPRAGEYRSPTPRSPVAILKKGVTCRFCSHKQSRREEQLASSIY
jgi:hypothetical protein